MIIVKDKKEKKEALRKLRESECFSIVNRGKVWYDLLTLEQEAELKEWYEEWLKVTETLVIPTKPAWLNEKLNTEVQYL